LSTPCGARISIGQGLPISYNLRNLVVRKTPTIQTALGIVLSVAVLLGIVVLVSGRRTTLSASGDPLNVSGAPQVSESELASNLARTQFKDPMSLANSKVRRAGPASGLVLPVPLSHIHGYPPNPNECRSCPGGDLLKEFKRSTNPTLVRNAGCEVATRKTECPKMEYRTLRLSCECGQVPKNISALGFSSTHDLVIHWQCARCHKNMCIVKPLSDCWRECFTEATVSTPKATADLTGDTPDDRRFLHSIGVKYSNE